MVFVLTKYVLKRLAYIVVVFFIVSFLMYCLFSLIPSDPARTRLEPMKQKLKPEVYEQMYQELRDKMGLDDPIVLRYLRWMGLAPDKESGEVNGLLEGYFGYSQMRQKDAIDVIKTPMGNTIFFNLMTTIFTLLITILLWISPSVSKTVEPYLVVLNSLPKSALAPLLIVWLGGNYKTIIVTGMSVAIFGSILSLYTDFMEVSSEKLKLIETLGGTRKDILCKILIPANIPSLLSIMKVDIGLCLVGVIIGEFIASRKGLGFLIIYGSQVFKLDWVLMSIIILCLIAIGLYVLIHGVEKWYVKRL